MGYSNDHYNYQVAVIFAILVGALLLLGIVLGGLYVCTKSMRDDEKDRKRYTSSGNSGQWPAQTQYRPASSQMYQPPQQQTNQSFEFAARSPDVPQTPVNVTQQYNPEPFRQAVQYSQPPLATPVSQDFINANRIQQVQPDVIYTQGPAGYVRSTPVEYSQAFHESTI